jgi:hypothetical protein
MFTIRKTQDILLLINFVSIIVISYFLTFAPVQNLVEINFQLKESLWLVHAAILITPLVLVMVKILISILIQKAKLDNDKNLSSLQNMGILMIFVTPILLTGEILLREDWYQIHNLITCMAFITLSFVCDTLLIFSGEQIYKALGLSDR